MICSKWYLFLGAIGVLNMVNVHAQRLDTDSIKYIYQNKIVPVSFDSKGDYLYVGIDNLLRLTYPDESSRHYKFILKTQNGFIDYSDSNYFTIPKHAGYSFISIHILINNRDTVFLGKKQFIVKNLPEPVLRIKNYILMDKNQVPRKVFNSEDSLSLFFTEDLPKSDKWYQINSFSINYTYGSKLLFRDNEGCIFSKPSWNFISKLPPGKEIILKITEITPDNVLKNMPFIRLSIL